MDAEALLMAIPGIAVSTGSACTSATVEPSHVLRALGIGEAAARSSVRFGLGRFNTEEEIDYAAGRVAEAVAKLSVFPRRRQKTVQKRRRTCRRGSTSSTILWNRLAADERGLTQIKTSWASRVHLRASAAYIPLSVAC